MNLKNLKELAEKNGLDFAKNANVNQMKELLTASDIEFIYEGESKSKSYTNEMFELDELIREYKYAESVLDLKKADQKRFILKTKIKGNRELMMKALKWERQRKIISSADTYVLNEMEKEDCDNLCTCIRAINSGGSFAEVSKEYKYLSYYDEGRGQEIFTLYIDRTIEPEEQIDKELAWKMSQGFMPVREDYKPARILWHRVSYVETEFNKYFKIDE